MVGASDGRLVTPEQPDIRFCQTTDGVRLAMGLYGSGPPLVRAGTWLSHVEIDAREGAFNRGYNDRFARDFRYLTYDPRATGLSDRHVDEISLDAWVRDLEAVVDALDLPRFVLFGLSMGAPISVRYAARHPERVSHLVLLGGFATSYFSTSKPDPAVVAEAETLLKIAEIGWGRASPEFRRVFATKFMPDASPEEQELFDELQRVANTPEAAVRILRAQFSINVKDDAARVRCPTLGMHCSGDRMIYADQGRRLAALIPGARFVPLDCPRHLPHAGTPTFEAMFAQLHGFLGTQAAAAPGSRLTPRQREVLREIAAGHTDKQIARTLGLSPRTVEMHVAAALRALGAATRAEAVHAAGRAGQLEPGG